MLIKTHKQLYKVHNRHKVCSIMLNLQLVAYLVMSSPQLVLRCLVLLVKPLLFSMPQKILVPLIHSLEILRLHYFRLHLSLVDYLLHSLVIHLVVVLLDNRPKEILNSQLEGCLLNPVKELLSLDSKQVEDYFRLTHLELQLRTKIKMMKIICLIWVVLTKRKNEQVIKLNFF